LHWIVTFFVIGCAHAGNSKSDCHSNLFFCPPFTVQGSSVGIQEEDIAPRNICCLCCSLCSFWVSKSSWVSIGGVVLIFECVQLNQSKLNKLSFLTIAIEIYIPISAFFDAFPTNQKRKLWLNLAQYFFLNLVPL
jgi:hypothetical protein